MRNIAINTKYLVLFYMPRQDQIRTLGCQLFPFRRQYFADKYREATSTKYGYLLVDLSPGVTDKLKTNIYTSVLLPETRGYKSMQRQDTVIGDVGTVEGYKSEVEDKPIEVNQSEEMATKTFFDKLEGLIKEAKNINLPLPSHASLNCMRCGVIFNNMPNLQKHLEWGCPLSPFIKRSREEDSDGDESEPLAKQPRTKLHPTNEGWIDWIWESGDHLTERKKTREAIKYYRNKGYCKEDACYKAMCRNVPNHQKALTKIYKEHLLFDEEMNKDPVHQAVVQEIKKLIKSEDYTYAQAVAKVLDEEKFQDLFCRMSSAYVEEKTDVPREQVEEDVAKESSDEDDEDEDDEEDEEDDEGESGDEEEEDEDDEGESSDEEQEDEDEEDGEGESGDEEQEEQEEKEDTPKYKLRPRT